MTDESTEAPPDSRPRIRALIVYQYIALYRMPIFEYLSNSSVIDFTFASGLHGGGETPKLVERDRLERGLISWIYLKNHWLPRNLLWQSNALFLSISNRYDVVIYLGDMHYISTWVSLIFRKVMGKKSALWTIGMHRPAFRFNLFVRKVWFFLAHKIFLYGDYGKTLLAAAGVSENKMSVIFNSLDFDRQSTIYERALICEHKATDIPLVVSMGRVTDRRKLDRLIEATALLRERGIDIQVRIIGNGPALPRLEALAAALGVTDRLHFLGAIYDEEVLASHLTAANVCVVPGIIGLGVVHAHTYGCPVITCGDMAIQAPEVEVMSPGVTGLFCDWDDSVSVANQIERWLSDGRTKAAIRKACRARVEACWTPAFQRAAIETAIEQLLLAQRA